MGVLEAIIFGVIQGVAEFLPISSSGHLALARNFFGTETELGMTFDIILHLATLLSVCVVYHKDVKRLFLGFFSSCKRVLTWDFKSKLEGDEKLFLMLCIATLPLIPVKLMGLDDSVEFLGTVSWMIGLLLIVNSLLLICSERLGAGVTTSDKGGLLRPLGVGLVQATLGILPGISRSGSTITGGRLCGYTREDAVRFSFLMSIPAILGAVVTEVPDALESGFDTSLALPILAGAVTAAIVGFFAIKLLQYLTKNKSFMPFAIYCAVVGVAAILLDIFNVSF